MTYPVRVYPAPILSTPAIAVPDDCFRPGVENDTLEAVVSHMRRTYRDIGGLGIAAPQLGIAWQLAVLHSRDTGREYVIINPSDIQLSGTITAGPEGCLSFPTVMLPVPRSAQISFRYQQLDSSTTSITAAGYLAIELQHELDHLAGILVIDRVKPLARRMAIAKLNKWKAIHEP